VWTQKNRPVTGGWVDEDRTGHKFSFCEAEWGSTQTKRHKGGEAGTLVGGSRHAKVIALTPGPIRKHLIDTNVSIITLSAQQMLSLTWPWQTSYQPNQTDQMRLKTSHHRQQRGWAIFVLHAKLHAVFSIVWGQRFVKGSACLQDISWATLCETKGLGNSLFFSHGCLGLFSAAKVWLHLMNAAKSDDKKGLGEGTAVLQWR